jgi:hypothetical protein
MSDIHPSNASKQIVKCLTDFNEKEENETLKCSRRSRDDQSGINSFFHKKKTLLISEDATSSFSFKIIKNGAFFIVYKL